MSSFYGVLLIIALVAVSGFIAYTGDIVGRRMGRKRLSLFGMRPRHTAIAVSVVAGMLITVLTLGVAMSVSRDVKDGFLRVVEMRQQLTALSRRFDDVQARTAEVERARDAAVREIESTQAELEALKEQLAETTEALGQEQEQLARATAARHRAETDLASADKAFRRLSEREDRLRSQLQGLRAQVASGILDRATPMLFGARQPIGVELARAGDPTPQIREGLDAFVSRLETTARAAGARPLAEQDAAVIIRKPVRDPETDAITWATSDQVLDAVAELIHESRGQVIVRAVSVFNTPSGDPVHVDFELFRNHLVFRRGETLAQTILDGRTSQPALMEALVGLLRDKVGEKARANNVMPRITPGTSEAFGGPRAPVGEMSFEELFVVVERLRRIDGPARVAAVASRDTWTIGPLEVDLVVEPIASGAPG